MVGSPIVAGATALSLVAAPFRVGDSVVPVDPILGSSRALEGLRLVPVGRFLALVLSGLTDPSLLVGV